MPQMGMNMFMPGMFNPQMMMPPMPASQQLVQSEQAPADSELVSTHSDIHMSVPKEILEAERKQKHAKRPADATNLQTKEEFFPMMMNPMMQ